MSCDAFYIVPVSISSVIGFITFIMYKTGIFSRFFRKVDPGSARHGGELVAEVLKAHKVKHIFCLSGGHISPILVAAEKQAIRVIDVRHEVTTVFAADAVARMSGQIGVAVVTAGPGLTNTVTAVKNAQMAESPVLLMGGAAAGILKGRGALQDIDQLSLFKSLCKFTATVPRVRDIVPTLRKAIQVAQSGTPGPVFVEFPIDTLYPYNLVQREIGQKDKSGGLVQKIVNMYLNHYLFNLFADAFEPADTSPLKVHVPEPNDASVAQTCELIQSAKRPVFVLGSQSTLPPVPADDTAESLKAIGIPCFLGGMSRGLLGRHSKIQIRQRRRDALREADLIILAGAVCDFRLGYGRTLNRRAKIVAINRDKQQLYKNSDMFWKPTIAIQADVGTTIEKIARRLKGNYACPKEWLGSLVQRDEEKEAGNATKAQELTKLHLNPVKVLLEAEEVIDDNAIMVADGGDFVGTAAYILRPRGPLTWLDPGAFGTLGVGGGFALGAKLTRPDSDVWIIYGDGSLGYSIAEFDTFSRHDAPCIALVGNDACWTQISREQVPLFGSNVACQLEFTDYHVVADGYGGKGYLLDRSKNEEIRKVLEDAQKYSREKKKPVLVNCLIGKSDFREGSISV